jgi:putative tryptophan/tyrosine transport system substrate-binding protein
MKKLFRVGFFGSQSDNLKSKIQNRKLAGLLSIIVALAFVFGGAVAEAQHPGKIFRIGFLDNSTASGMAVLLEAFRQELIKLGWIEGKNITFESRYAEQSNERLHRLAADLVRLKVDLIVVTSTGPALAAKKATTTIPIVMTTSTDAVGVGLVASLARPGGNVTGLSGLATELNTNRLEVLKDAVPKLARVGLLRPAGGSDRQLKDLRPAALALKLKLEEIETQFDPKGLESAFQTAKQKQVGAIMTTVSPLSRRKKAHRRAFRQVPVACYLPTEGVCR